MLVSFWPFTQSQGRVRTRTVKRASKLIIEKYYPRLTEDFHTNKRTVEEIAVVPSKRLRNKIAGYTTHLMRRIAKGPVKGISFKLQEEERERKDNYVPEQSVVDVSHIEIDPDTASLLRHLRMQHLPGIHIVTPNAYQFQRGRQQRS